MRFTGSLIALLVLTGSALAAEIKLKSPLDYQVFQRQTRTAGVVVVEGSVEGALQVRFRMTGKSPQGSLKTDWQTVEADKQSGSFLAKVSVPAGGWYRVEIRTGDSGGSPDAIVEHVGVGEVFVIAGQSNSTNYGKPRQKVGSGLVSTFDGTAWRIADDPQPGTQDKSSGGSFVPSFGDAMAEKYHVPVAVASVGMGGTSVREWLPRGDRMQQQPTTGKHVKSVGEHEWESTGELFDALMKRINQFGPYGFRAVLWHQGESDAGQARSGYPADRQITGEQYREWMKRLIDQSQKHAGWEFPWFIAQATYHSEKDPADDEFRAAQKSLWEDHTALPGPDTDQLTADYRDGVHFNHKGLKAHGTLWAEKVGAYLDPALAQSPTAH